ncbi:MAG: SHOCT domain-containing protein [Bacteroidales bacterium]|nr:SHOCT domain-containing protein [Bacteroidales bacterium]
MLQEEQITRLKELKQLLDSGVLSEEEFAAEKAKIMSQAEKAPAASDAGGKDAVAGIIDGVVSYFKGPKLRIVQIILLALTALSVCIYDDADDLYYYNKFFFYLPIVLAVITIVLSWIGKGRIPKWLAIVSTVISVIVALVPVLEYFGF